MNDRIRAHVEHLFQGAPATNRVMELKEELISNLIDRYNDLVEQGKEPEVAFGIAVSGIGDVKDLIRNMRDQDVFNPAVLQRQRQRSAVFISLAVGIYIISIIFPACILPLTGRVFFSIGAMFACWAVATTMLIYNALSKPKYIKNDETIVEDFKRWSVERNRENDVIRSVQSIVWVLAVVLFFLVGTLFHAYHISWLSFILAVAVNQIVRLIFLYKEEK